MTAGPARPLSVLGLLVAFALAACGSGDRGSETPADQVRQAASVYLRALQGGRWARACRLMTVSARRELEDARGSCGRALEKGAALPDDQLAAAARAVAGAHVRVRVGGTVATIGPLGSSPQPLRLERVDGRWLVAG